MHGVHFRRRHLQVGVPGQKIVHPVEANENVSIALRGFDPMIYAAIDFIVLLVDGNVKPIYISPRVQLKR